MLTALLSAASFVVLLGVLVTIHEGGHFLVAKACGVRVLTFSLGFGPRLFGFRRGDTDYRLSAIPLGGYVRMYGDDITEDVPESERRYSFLHKPFLQKSAIALAGPAANLLLPIFLFASLAVGTHTVADTVVGTVFPGDPAARAGILPGDRITAVEGEPVAAFDDVRKHIEPRAGLATRVTVDRAGVSQELVVTPTAVPTGNPIDPDETMGRIGMTSLFELPVVTVRPGTAAAQAGIAPRDRITHVDGVPVATRAALFAALQQAGPHDLSLTVVTKSDAPRTVVVPAAATDEAAAGSALEVETLRYAVTEDELDATLQQRIAATAQHARDADADARATRGIVPIDGVIVQVDDGTPAALRGMKVDDQILAIDGEPLAFAALLDTKLRTAPDAVHVIAFRSGDQAKVLAFRMAPSPRQELGGMKVFGAVPANALGDGAEVQRTTSLGTALEAGFAQTVQLTRDTVRGLGALFGGRVGLSGLSGPLTIANLAGKAADLGLPTFIGFMAFISISLGVFNLLPVPVLDGGHLLMFIIEAVKGKALSLRTRERAAQLGLVLVLMLMVVALHNDIASLFFKGGA